ncbi:hemolysin family protein [Kocuria flava]|uniref:hemolysin family protein n=1 Tax=Kocuria flava TaxID=446860 RepID=UPI002F9227FE
MDWLLLATGLLLILGTGFFVAVEFSLVALDQTTVRRAIAEGDRRAEPLLKCLRSLSTQLSSCQLGITLTTLLTGYTLDLALQSFLREPIMDLTGLSAAAAGGVTLTISMLISTLLSMLVGELVPKNWAIAEAYRVGRALARPQLVFTAVFKPFVLGLNGVANRVLHLFGMEAKEELSGARSPEELSSMVRRSAKMGTLDAGTAAFVAKTLTFAERTAADVMTPRIRVQMLDSHDSVAEVVAVASRTGHSRFPVVDDSPDEIRGVVHVKKAVAVPADRRAALECGAIMEDVLRVPETVHLDSLLVQLRSGGLQMAVVVDEWGGTAGVVTLEDLVEEVVGEVSDEHDRISPGALQSASGEWTFPGLLRPDEVSEQIIELDIEDGPAYETMGGFMMDRLGRVPRVGDAVPVQGGVLEVARMDGRRVDRIRFVPAPAPAPTEEGTR